MAFGLEEVGICHGLSVTLASVTLANLAVTLGNLALTRASRQPSCDTG
jgi:hypothetical protein